VQRWLSQEGLRGAAWRAREMTEADHVAFDAYTGPPASTWFWMVRP
jgi:hypothetical protein